MQEYDFSILIDEYKKQAVDYAKRSLFGDINQSNDDFSTLTGLGTLKIQVSAGEGTFPVEETHITVYSLKNGNRRLFFDGKTDNSGLTENITLPAKPIILSQSEITAAGSQAEYFVSYENPLFEKGDDITVQIFDKTETILPITLEPKLRQGE